MGGKNVYNIYDEHTMCGIPHNSDDVFYFDKEDFIKIKDVRWGILNKKIGRRGLYLRGTLNGKMELLHRVILNFPIGFIDHIDRDSLNNRKNNLRTATMGQNNINQKNRADNVTGIKGVSWNSRNNNWRAILDLNYERILDKSFKNIDDAIKERLIWEKKYYEEFAPQKHLFEKYGV